MDANDCRSDKGSVLVGMIILMAILSIGLKLSMDAVDNAFLEHKVYRSRQNKNALINYLEALGNCQKTKARWKNNCLAYQEARGKSDRLRVSLFRADNSIFISDSNQSPSEFGNYNLVAYCGLAPKKDDIFLDAIPKTGFKIKPLLSLKWNCP